MWAYFFFVISGFVIRFSRSINLVFNYVTEKVKLCPAGSKTYSLFRVIIVFFNLNIGHFSLYEIVFENPYCLNFSDGISVDWVQFIVMNGEL